MPLDGSEAARFSSSSNVPGSDITVESSDNIRFFLHRKNIETHARAFPGLDSGPDSEDPILRLKEAAEVLDNLFPFLYPRRQPVLSLLRLESLLALAEAVQKYQVFSAMNGCEIHLRNFVQEDALSIFVHCLRYYGGYETLTLVDECARLLIRTGQSFVIVHRFAKEGLHIDYTVRWVKYEAMWEDLFKKVKGKIDDIPLHEDCWTDKHLCSNCRDCLISWVDGLRETPTIPALLDALDHPKFLKQHHKQSHDRCRYCRRDECKHRAPLVTFCRTLVDNMPAFTSIPD